MTDRYAGRDVGWLVRSWAEREPTRPFLVWHPVERPRQDWSRADFARDVERVAAALHRRGIGPGGRGALVLPNGPAFLLGWCALASLGATAVCLNPDLSADELAYALAHSGAGLVVTTEARAHDAALAAPAARLLLDRELLTVLVAEDAEPVPGPEGTHVAASIQYTSGTTARPKGVVWSQANCLWAGQVGAAHQRLGQDDTYLVHLPLFHTNALSYSFLSSLWAGSTVVLTEKFSASRFWDVSVEHGVTWTSVVSFCLRALAGRPVPEGHRYRGWASSAEVDPADLTGGVPVTGWFGMTETVSHPIVSDPHHPLRAGSMGRPSPAYDVAVTDEEGRPVATGEVGELRVRGRSGVSLFSEYLDAPEQTAAAFDERGWFRTGDRVRSEADGSWWFVERDKDVLKVGGENIGAPEIERVLLGVPGVREAAVVGRPDRMLGEVPVAFVTTQPGATVTPEDAAAVCARMLTSFKRPREIRVVPDLPRSTLDKVAKSALRDLVSREAVSDG